MADKPEKIQPEGSVTEWTETAIDRLIGLRPDGTLSPAVIADARADARQYPELDALLRAKRLKRRGP
jgi:hypothetical protein